MTETAEHTKDVLQELHMFLFGATRNAKCNDLKLTRTALSLLKSLPASRDAVLQYLFSVFDYAVRNYASYTQKDQFMKGSVPVSSQEDAVISEIHGVLCNFVSLNPEAWAPIISSWSLQLLGQLSSKYSKLPPSVGLNETLHWWMSCKAVRSLVDITTQCLHCLIDADTEACVSSLLDTSITHSPHFDWVVAHVGSCFSNTIITRVLSLGLKDFCKSNKPAKLKSVVGILGHLGASHFAHVRSALLSLFQWSQLQRNQQEARKQQAVVPYLLQLSSQSPILLQALSIDVFNNLNLTTLLHLAKDAPTWLQYFQNDREKMEDLVVSLTLRCQRGGPKIFSLLLEAATCDHHQVAITAKFILELLLEEIEMQWRTNRGETIPFLDSFKLEWSLVRTLLTTENALFQRYICRLFLLMEKLNRTISVKAVAYLLRCGSTMKQKETLMLMIGVNEDTLLETKKEIFSNAIEQAIRDSFRDRGSVGIWQNLTTLLRQEAANSSKLSGHVVAESVLDNMDALSEAINSRREAEAQDAVMAILDLLPLSSFSSLPLQLTLRLTQSAVTYFFFSVSRNDGSDKTVCCRRACDVLQKLCFESAVARSLALRHLLESALFLSEAPRFGSTRKPVQRLADRQYSLNEQNHKLGVCSTLVGRQSSVFGNSVVPSSKGIQETFLTPYDVDTNIHHFVDAIRSCCLVRSPTDPGDVIISLDAMVQVALLLVELISPDVMYNGLPWPEEEFCKVTIERDIHIRRVFDEVPASWLLLELVARHEPALCYCSVLLRALMASLISQWGSPSSARQPSVLQTTIRLLRLMCLGQLLPPPLTSLHEILPHVSSLEVLSLLRSCVWNYMRDHVPSPALFTQDARSGLMWRDSSLRPALLYTEPMRQLMLANIRHFGPLYLHLFVRP